MRALLSVWDKTGIVEFARGCTSSASSSCRRAARPRPSTKPGSRSRTSPTSPASPRCSTTAWSRCTRRCTAASSPTAARSRTSPTWRAVRHRAVRHRREQPLPVPRVARHRDHRHRWPGDDARGGEEPRVGRDRHRAPTSTTTCSRSCAPTASSATRLDAFALEAFAATRWRTTPHRRLRRAIVAVAQERRRALPPAPRARARPHRRAAALRREPAPGRARYRTVGHHELVGRRHAAQRPRAQLPQPLRRRRRVAARARSRASDRPTVAIIKHANPCGVAVAADLATAYQRALECDERSAFGGIVALNRPIDAATVERMVAGPAGRRRDRARLRARHHRGAAQEAQEHPSARGAVRPKPPGLDFRQISGGFLVQDAHHFAPAATTGGSSPSARPPPSEWRDAELAWRICGHVKSNAIVLVKDGQAVGIGAGQQNRVESGEIAAKKAAGRAGRRVRVGRVLPVPRRHRGGRRGGRRGRGAARWLGRRREGHRTRRRARPRHGVHRRTALPALRSCLRSSE